MLAAAKNPSPEVARDLLIERRRLLLREGQIYQELAAAGHPVPQKRYAEDLAAFGAEFADVPLQFGGLKPVVEGQVYEGTKKQINDAFAEADKMGVLPERTFDDTKGVWRIKAGERTIEVHDRDWKPALPPTEPVPAPAEPAKPTAPTKPAAPGEEAPTQFPSAPHQNRSQASRPHAVSWTKSIGRTSSGRRILTSLPPPTQHIEVQRGNLRTTKPEFVRTTDFPEGAWKWSLYDEVSGAKVCETYVKTTDNQREPVGWGNWLEAKQALLPSGECVQVNAKGFRWSDAAWDSAMNGYREMFGSAPPNASGELARSNLEVFHEELCSDTRRASGMVKPANRG